MPRVTHKFVSGKAQGPDTSKIYGPQWNEEHVIEGLENVDNTSDLDKPISTATAAALSAKASQADLALKADKTDLDTKAPIDIPFKYPAASSISRGGYVKMADQADVRDWGAVCDGTTNDTAKVQAAFNECPVNETLHGPLGKKILISANGAQCLNLTRPVRLADLYLVTANTLGSTIDMLAITPTTGNWYGWTMSDCRIGDDNIGRFGRHGIHIQTSSSTSLIQGGVLTRLKILNGAATVGNAIRITNTNEPNGGWSGSVIRDCNYLAGGITLVQVGDRNTIENCVLNPHNTGGSLVDVDFIAGAMNFQFIRNNCGDVSLFFRSGLNPYVAYNTFEQTGAGFQPNNSVADFDGTNVEILGPVVENNVFQMLTAVPSVPVRFNKTLRARLKGGNKLHMPTSATPVIVTANSKEAFVSRNQQAATNGAAWVSGVNNIASHEKPVSNRYVLDANVTISAVTPDHTVSLNSTLSVDRTWTLPPLSHCFPGEEFVCQDLTFSLGTRKVILARSGADTFAGGATTFDMAVPGARIVLSADPQASIWVVSTIASAIDIDSTMAANSDARIPTQKAVSTALAAKASTAAMNAALALKADKTAFRTFFAGNSGSTGLLVNQTKFLVTTNFDPGESNVYIPIPAPGTFSNLSFTSAGAPGNSQTFTATIRKTLADTAVTCQISGSGSNTAADNVNTVHFNAGDRFCVKIASSINAAGSGFAYSCVFTPD